MNELNVLQKRVDILQGLYINANNKIAKSYIQGQMDERKKHRNGCSGCCLNHYKDGYTDGFNKGQRTQKLKRR